MRFDAVLRCFCTVFYCAHAKHDGLSSGCLVNFVLKMMNYVLEMMDVVLNVLNVMNFVLKTMD